MEKTQATGDVEDVTVVISPQNRSQDKIVITVNGKVTKEIRSIVFTQQEVERLFALSSGK